MSFDLSKCPKNSQGHYLCRTRDGRKVRLVATDFRQTVSTVAFPLGGFIEYADKTEKFCSWQANGKNLPFADSLTDLENLPTKVKRWVNFHNDGHAFHYDSQAEAEAMASRSNQPWRHIAIAIPVEFEVKP